MIDPFTKPPHLPLIAPSILAADFGSLADQCRGAMDAGADLLHVDIMDGRFVPNLSMGPAVVAAIREAVPGAFLDVHLMVQDPDFFVEPFVEAGANLLSFHIEVCDGDDAARLIQRIRGFGVKTGLVVNPKTPAQALLPLLPEIDLALVMSVQPGFGGQAFIPEVLEKGRLLRAAMRDDQRLEIDGGIGLETGPLAVQAGFDLLVAGSSFFRSPRSEWSGVVQGLRSPAAWRPSGFTRT